MTDYQLLIDGELVDSPQTMDVINPATEEIIATCPRGTKELADKAIAAAKKAFPAWSKTPLKERAALLNKLADAMEEHSGELTTTLTREQGKPLAEAEQEIQFSIIFVRYFAAQDIPVRHLKDDENCRIEEHHIPLGVVGGIIPWNFPMLVMMAKLPPALLAGNTIVLKPSPTTPLGSLRVCELAKDIFPAGVVNIITDQNDLGSYLTKHPDIAKISFTGSVATGKKVMESTAATLKRITLELGGNDPGIILDDVNVDEVAQKVFAAAFVNCGQVCLALKRIYIHESIYEELCNKLVEHAKAAIVDDGSLQGTTIGPLQNKTQYEKVQAFLEQAKSDGNVAVGGEVMERAGYFIQPTIIRDIEDGAQIVDEEQFGPILPLVKYKNLDEVIDRINESEYGLGASVWSRDVDKAQDIAKRVVAGTVWVNQHFAMAPDVPFGGAKSSGIGVEFAEEGLAEYTQRQIINVAK